jgi:hypothetical protein
MSIIGLLFFIALVGLVAWALTALIPMPQGIKTAIYVVALIIVVLIAAHAFGLTGDLNTRVPQLR